MEEKIDLLIDENYCNPFDENECKEVQSIIKDFVGTYASNKEESVESWLVPKMQEYLPGAENREIHKIADDIVSAISLNDEKKVSLENAIADGRSKESWFASEFKKSVYAAKSVKDSIEYATSLDNALNKVNEALYNTIHTKAGLVNQNPQLDGFIAEQYHAQTFNLHALSSGSEYRARVLEPEGTTYGKNSVDIVIEDVSSGKVVKRYQSKYCKDATATERAFRQGDYRGQQKLVPEDQIEDIRTKVSTVIEAPDGTISDALSKVDAEQLRDDAQSGNWDEIHWNEYKERDLAIGLSKKVGYAALQGAAIGAGFEIAEKIWNGEKIEAEHVVETALESGVDFGIKAATAGALQIGVRKGYFKKLIPPDTDADTIVNIAYVAVEDVKILNKVAKGELTIREGIDKIEQTTVATTAGLFVSAKASEKCSEWGVELGNELGAKLGVSLGPAGAAIGTFIGGTIGYMAGSKVGEVVTKCAQKIRNVGYKVIKTTALYAKRAVSSAVNSVKSFCSSVCSFFGL